MIEVNVNINAVEKTSVFNISTNNVLDDRYRSQ